tara:strand:- start:2070 stop:2279 length:210 start_codon:yes stop_codon:yes gene_type:complete
MSNNLTQDFIIENISGSNEQHTTPSGHPLTVAAMAVTSKTAAPIFRLGVRGPINLRLRPADAAYKVTVG